MFTPLHRTSDLAARATEALIVAAGLAMTGFLFAQVISRYVFNSALVWSEELAVLLFCWLLFLAGSLGVKRRFHVRLEFIVAALPGGVKRSLDYLTDLAVLALAGLMVVKGGDYAWQTHGQVSAAVQYPISLLHGAVPVAGAPLLLRRLSALTGDPPAAADEDSVSASGPLSLSPCWC